MLLTTSKGNKPMKPSLPQSGLGIIAVICCLCILAPTHLAQSQTDNLVLRWSAATVQAVRNTRLGPPMTARALAITHTAMYDAWAAYDSVAVGTRLGATLRRPVEEHTAANKAQAISFAAYRTLVDLFPTQTALFDALMLEQGFDKANVSTAPTTAAGVGNAAAAAVLAFRHQDGSNQLGDLAPGAYADYTNYRPVNSADIINDPNRWQPLRLPNGAVQTSMVPQWGRVLPFALSSGAEILPEKTPALIQHTQFGWAYYRQAFEVLNISANLDDRTKMISEYWADGPGSETPPGHWCVLAREVSLRDKHDLDQDVKMYFALANGLLDVSISVWHWKRALDYVRPITAIRYLFKGQRVYAWGGPNQGRQLIYGENWQPYQVSTFVTPPFAEYISGHSTFSAASAEILKQFTGSDAFASSAKILAGSSKIEPGVTPANDLTLTWATFTEAAEEAGISRLYGGIHFNDGNIEGQKMGRKIGLKVWQKAQSYFDGTALSN
jgi:hypothetical protein